MTRAISAFPQIRVFAKIRLRAVVMLGVAGLAAGCSERESNFSQYPGFAEWYAENPPSDDPPTAGEKALLERYKPRFHLPEGHEGPIDFYLDYVAQGQMVDAEGKLISDKVTADLLNAKKLDPTVAFTHVPTGEAVNPTVYGRLAKEAIDWPGCDEPVPLTFLNYHLVFRYSGLPAELPSWQAVPLSLIADLDDWHQLDHYTAVIIALSQQAEEPPVPLAATFQQHNYQRTYLLSDDEGPGRLALPADGRIEIDIAERSNELYPHAPKRTVRRAMSFMDPEGARYMVADGAAPWLAADDRTDPAIAIDPALTFLPPNDAFYTFQGWLGERRRLPGRDGPPGADYNTLPPMKPLVHQMALSYWYDDDLDWLTLYESLFKDGRPKQIDPVPFIEKMAGDLDSIC